MRTIWRWFSLAWLVLVGLVFVLPFPPIMRDPHRQVGIAWKGATLDWSPRASTMDTGTSAQWDVAGWLDEGTTELHKSLDRIERQLWLNLDVLLSTVYEWRDQQ